MISPKIFLKALPWFILVIVMFTLYVTNHWPFDEKAKQGQILIESSLILNKIERLGKLELVKYNFNEVFEYKQLSDGKIIGNSILNNYNFDADLSVVLIASGEAVGCIDLTKLDLSDVRVVDDTLVISLPPPELCYHKLDMANTKIHSFVKESWWSRMFSDEDEKTEVLQLAYRQAEAKLLEAAIKSGIFKSTNDNATLFLKPFLEEITGIEVQISTSIPTLDMEVEL